MEELYSSRVHLDPWARSRLARLTPCWGAPLLINQSPDIELCEETKIEYRKLVHRASILPMVAKATGAYCFLVTTPPKIASIGASQGAASIAQSFFTCFEKKEVGGGSVSLKVIQYGRYPFLPEFEHSM